jgi:glutamate synthase domain-containing protein 2
LTFQSADVFTMVQSCDPILIDQPNGTTTNHGLAWKHKEDFPLLDLHDPQIGQYNCYEYHMDIELTVYGYANEKTGEPDKRATTAFEFWQHTHQSHEENEGPPPHQATDPDKFRDTEEARDKKVARDEQALKDLEREEANMMAAGVDPGDPLTWTEVPTEPTPKAIKRPEAVIKADDGKPLNADIGGFHIFHKPIELLPQMADENGQIKLTVVVQMDDDGKKPKAIVTTDNKGWMHFS